MLRNDKFAVGFTSVYLFIYLTLLQFDQCLGIAFLLLLLSPVLIGFMVYTILKYGKYNGPEPGDEAFGYQDKR